MDRLLKFEHLSTYPPSSGVKIGGGDRGLDEYPQEKKNKLSFEMVRMKKKYTLRKLNVRLI